MRRTEPSLRAGNPKHKHQWPQDLQPLQASQQPHTVPTGSKEKWATATSLLQTQPGARGWDACARPQAQQAEDGLCLPPLPTHTSSQPFPRASSQLLEIPWVKFCCLCYSEFCLSCHAGTCILVTQQHQTFPLHLSAKLKDYFPQLSLVPQALLFLTSYTPSL